jgi:hypothetical protein
MVRCSANGVRLVIPAGGLELGNYLLVAGAGFCEGVGQATLDDFTRPRTRKASVTGAKIVFGPFACCWNTAALRSGLLRHALAREAQQSRGFRDFKKVRPAPGGERDASQ